MFDYDLFVIGAGSGGVRASRMASLYGARVGICEEYRVGGTCVIRGCVPKKLMVYGSHFSDDFEDAAGYGWTVPPASFDWATLIANKDREIDRLNGIYIRNLKAAGVTLYQKRAVLRDAHAIDLGNETVTAQNILIATGGTPSLPEIPGIEHAITSNEAFHLESLPERVVVVGGGYIAVEFAGIFHGFGADVTLLYRGEQILRGFDRTARDFVAREMCGKGMDIRVDAQVERIEKHGDAFRLCLAGGDSMICDLVMYATGRAPNTNGLGLEDIGVELAANGAVVVDEYSRSSVPHIYAVGDCTDRINLTPVAIKEGAAFAATVFDDNPQTVDYRDVASAVFSQPPLATVGLSEEDARREYDAIDVYLSTFRPMKHTLSGREEKALMKLIVDRSSDRVLGAHMVGLDAAEIIQGIAIAVKCGATKADFDATVAIHPSTAEEFVLMREPVAGPDHEVAAAQ
ncbi:MAG: glutathione-disulfide reductase [Sphingomonadales bacterium]